MITLNEMERTGMLDGYIAKANTVQLETMLQDFRTDKEKYGYLKKKVTSIRNMSVHIEHDFPRIRQVQV